MLNRILATTALATVLALGAQAQTTTDTDTTTGSEATPDSGASTDTGSSTDTGATTEGETSTGTATTEEAEPVEAEPIEAEPMEAEPVEAEPMEAEPVEAEPVEVEPVEAEPEAEVEVIESESVEMDAEVTDVEEEAPEMTEETDAGPMMNEGLIGEGYVAADLSILSVEELVGADINNSEGEQVASVDDVILTTSGQIESIVAKFGGFLGFGAKTTLLEMSNIAIVRDGEESISVLTSLTPEELESRPEYEG